MDPILAGRPLASSTDGVLLVGGDGGTALPIEDVLNLEGGPGGGAKLDRAGDGPGGGGGIEDGSASESARTRAGGAGATLLRPFGSLRAGGGGTALTGDPGPALDGRAGGGGGGGLPGVAGCGGAFLFGDCKLLRGGMAGTGREMAEDAGGGGGGVETCRLGKAGEGRAGGAGGDALRIGGGALRGGAGALVGGAGTVREGRLGAGRFGGVETVDAGFGGGTALLGGGGAEGVDAGPSRLGIEGGFPNVGGLARMSILACQSCFHQ